MEPQCQSKCYVWLIARQQYMKLLMRLSKLTRVTMEFSFTYSETGYQKSVTLQGHVLKTCLKMSQKCSGNIWDKPEIKILLPLQRSNCDLDYDQSCTIAQESALAYHFALAATAIENRTMSSLSASSVSWKSPQLSQKEQRSSCRQVLLSLMRFELSFFLTAKSIPVLTLKP